MKPGATRPEGRKPRRRRARVRQPGESPMVASRVRPQALSHPPTSLRAASGPRARCVATAGSANAAVVSCGSRVLSCLLLRLLRIRAISSCICAASRARASMQGLAVLIGVGAIRPTDSTNSGSDPRTRRTRGRCVAPPRRDPDERDEVAVVDEPAQGQRRSAHVDRAQSLLRNPAGKPEQGTGGMDEPALVRRPAGGSACSR